jgi:radical SAM protein with 4Fe4S-binding SPASM domain
MSDFQVLLDRLPFAPASVILSGIGEPLLNPVFFQLVDMLAEHGIGCRFFTNGTLLSNSVRESILCRHNITGVAISCDSEQREVFESLRIGAKFEQWYARVRKFLAEAKAQRGRSLEISMFTVLSKHNVGNVGGIVRFSSQLGFRHLVFFDPIPLDPVAASIRPSKEDLSTIDQVRLKHLGRSQGTSVDVFARREMTPPRAHVRCLQPWDYVFIRVNGNVNPCRNWVASEDAPVMGNIFERDFTEIWQGERFREFRRSSAQGSNRLCRICPYH